MNESTKTPLNITVLGSGCPTCKKLHQIVKRAAALAGVTEEVKYVPDIKEVMKLGVRQTPVIAIRGKVVMTGFKQEPEAVKTEAIKKLIEAALAE